MQPPVWVLWVIPSPYRAEAPPRQAGKTAALSLSLSNPVTVLGTTNADAAGNAAIPANLPAGISGMRVWVQAVDVTSCAQSNGATMIVG